MQRAARPPRLRLDEGRITQRHASWNGEGRLRAPFVLQEERLGLLRANLQISQLPAETSLPVVISDLRSIVRVADKAHTQIAAIPRPPAELALINALLANDTRGRGLMAEQIVPALRALRPGQRVGAAYIHASKELDTLNTVYNGMARALGARVCALNPRPGGAGTIH